MLSCSATYWSSPLLVFCVKSLQSAVYHIQESLPLLCVVCGIGSLRTSRISEAMELQTPPTNKWTVSCFPTQEGVAVTTLKSSVPATAAVGSSLSSPGAGSPTSLVDSENILVKKPLLPVISCAGTQSTVPANGVFIVEGRGSSDAGSSAIEDTELTPSVSSGTNSQKNICQSAGVLVEGPFGDRVVGSDESSKPQTIRCDIGDASNVCASSYEERKNIEALLEIVTSTSGSKLMDINENVGRNGFSIAAHIKDEEMAAACQKLGGLLGSEKVATELVNGSQFMPVTTRSVVVNMVLSTAVTEPEGQSTTEPDVSNHSQANSECDMSISDEASTQEASNPVSAETKADKSLEQHEQQEKSSAVAEEGSTADPANSDERNDAARKTTSAEGGSHDVRKRSKSPASRKSRSCSRSKKRDHSRSRESRRRKSRSKERRKNRSRSSERSRKGSRKRSADPSPSRDGSQRRDRKRSRSNSRSRRHRSSSGERRRRTSPSRSGHRRRRSRSPSQESRQRRSRSRSRDSRRRSRSADGGRRRQKSRSRSKDRSHQGDRRSTRGEGGNDRSVRNVKLSSFSKNLPSDNSRDLPPPHPHRRATREEELDKSRSLDVEASRSRRHSDCDLSGTESGQRSRSREENMSDNNRIAVISSSSGTSRQHHEEYESDDEPPTDSPAAYDPSEPTEDNVREDVMISNQRQMLPHQVPPANQRVPLLDLSRPPPGFMSRLPAPPVARFQPHPPREGVLLDVKAPVMPQNHFGVTPAEGGRLPPPPPPMMSIPRPMEMQPYTRPLLTTPASALPPPPPPSVLTRGIDAVPVIVRGPVEPARLVFVPPTVRLPRIVCPPAQGAMPDLVQIPVGQPRPGTILSAPPFVSVNQVIRPASMVFQQIPEHLHANSPQPAPQVVQNLPIGQLTRMTAPDLPMALSTPDVPFPPSGGQSTMPNVALLPAHPAPSQSKLALSSSSASSPSSGSQDAEDMLLERYSAKPEPPKSLFPSQSVPKPPIPVVDVQQKSPVSDISEKSPPHVQPPQPPPLPSPPLPESRQSVSTVLDVVPTSGSAALPSDPRLLVQFILNQARQSSSGPEASAAARSGDETAAPVKPSSPLDLPTVSNNLPPEVSAENSPGKISNGKAAYSPSQADFFGAEEGEHSENVRELKVCWRLSFLCCLFNSVF